MHSSHLKASPLPICSSRIPSHLTRATTWSPTPYHHAAPTHPQPTTKLMTSTDHPRLTYSSPMQPMQPHSSSIPSPCSPCNLTTHPHHHAHVFIFHTHQTHFSLYLIYYSFSAKLKPQVAHGSPMAIIWPFSSSQAAHSSLMATIWPSYNSYVAMHGHLPKPFSKPTKFNFLSFQNFQNPQNSGFNFLSFHFQSFQNFENSGFIFPFPTFSKFRI